MYMPKTEKPRATVRQKLVAARLLEIIGKGKGTEFESLGKILLEAGYSKNVADSPALVTERKGFQALMKKYLPENEILLAHKQLLSSVNIDNYVFSIAVTDADIRKMIAKVPGAKLLKISRTPTTARAYFTYADNRSRKDAIDMAYKLNGSYAAEKQEHSVTPEISRIIEHMKSVLPAAK